MICLSECHRVMDPSLRFLDMHAGVSPSHGSVSQILCRLNLVMVSSWDHQLTCELNPGPWTPHTKIPNVKYVKKACRWGQRAIVCDWWYQINCLGVASQDFSYTVHNQMLVGYVAHVDYLTFQFPCLNLLSSTHQIYSTAWIHQWTQHTALIQARHSTSLLHNNFCMISLNRQDIRAKKASFMNRVESANPDNIVGTETWLRPDIRNSEFTPQGYTVIDRRDISDGYGEVFIRDCSIFIRILGRCILFFFFKISIDPAGPTGKKLHAQMTT